MRQVFLLITLLTASCVTSTPAPHVVGIWAPPHAVLKGTFLFEGQAIYLGEDCLGALVGGPPPIGVRIVASYKAGASMIDFEMTENDETVGSGTLIYDPKADTMAWYGKVYTRRFFEFDPGTRLALGLEPVLADQVTECGG